MADEKWLYSDRIREATDEDSETTVIVSSQAGGQTEVANLNDVEGSIQVQIVGDFTGADVTPFAVQVTEIGTQESQMTADGDLHRQPMPSAVKTSNANAGNGTCQVEVRDENIIAADFTIECMTKGTAELINAHGSSADYQHEEAATDMGGIITGMRYENNVVGEEGVQGNNAWISFTKMTEADSAFLSFGWDAGPPDQRPATTGRTLVSNVEWDDYEMFINGDPSLSPSDLIVVGNNGAARPTEATGEQVHLVIECAAHGSTGNWRIVFWPRPADLDDPDDKTYFYDSGGANKEIFKVNPTSGYKITVTPAAAAAQTFYGWKNDGVNAPIRTVHDAWQALNNDLGIDAAGNIVPNTGIEAIETGWEQTPAPLQPERDAAIPGATADGPRIALTGGQDAGDYAIFKVVTISEKPIFLNSNTLYANSAWITLGYTDETGNEVAETRLKLTEGSVPFEIKDKFEVYLRQAKIKISTDEMASWGTEFSIGDNTGDVSNELDVPITYGVEARLKAPADGNLFVVGDIFHTVCSYRHTWRNLANGDRFKRWRTRLCSAPQVIYLDAGTGNTLGMIHHVALCDHNLTVNTATIDVKGIAGTDIEKCLGEADTVGHPAFLVNMDRLPAANEYDGGYVHFYTGLAQGLRYQITSHNVPGVNPVTLTMADDVTADGAADGDLFILVPAASSAIYDDESNTLTVNNAVKYAGVVASIGNPGWDYRGCIVIITDTGNADGYLEFSQFRLGEIMQPTSADGYIEGHNYLTQTTRSYEDSLMTDAGIFRPKPRGVKHRLLPLEYGPLDPATTYSYDQLKTMVEYCNHYDRKVAPMFWQDSDQASDFVVGYLLPEWTDTREPIHHYMTINMHCLEVT